VRIIIKYYILHITKYHDKWPSVRLSRRVAYNSTKPFSMVVPARAVAATHRIVSIPMHSLWQSTNYDPRWPNTSGQGSVGTGLSAIKDSWALSWKSRFIASRRAIDQKLGDDLAVLFNSCTYTLYRSLYHFIGCARSKSISFVIHLIQIWLVLTDHFCSCNCLVT
jgi:hypothetical protein